MSTVVLPPPKEIASYSSHALPHKKSSKKKLSKPENPNSRKNPSLLKHPDLPINATKSIRNTRKSDCRGLIMEDVKILKRGEEIPTPCLTDRLGPDPKFLPNPSGPAYAGPAFISSPSPTSLPVPLFLKKAAFRGEDVATRGICYLLRLDVSR